MRLRGRRRPLPLLLALGGGLALAAAGCGGSGSSTGVDAEQAEPPIALLPAAAVTGGDEHTCALTMEGLVRCWGWNQNGQLGSGGTGPFQCGLSSCALKVVDASGLAGGVASVAAGRWHSCAVLASGGMRCWGRNTYGQLGNGDTDDSSSPVEVAGVSGATQAAAGRHHTCVLTSQGAVQCWGRMDLGQLGSGVTTSEQMCGDFPCALSPAAVSGLAAATQIAAGANHTCALLGGGTVECWGDNRFGQLGDGTRTTRPAPVAVAGVANVTALSAGEYHTCALDGDGEVHCWGQNIFGQLGNGNREGPQFCTGLISCSLVPVEVGNRLPATALSAGEYHTCALLEGGTVECWGLNDEGQLGDGTDDDRDVPVQVEFLTDAAAIGLGGKHSCAVTTQSDLKCWGRNAFGQLGTGTTEPATAPLPVIGFGVEEGEAQGEEAEEEGAGEAAALPSSKGPLGKEGRPEAAPHGPCKG